MRPTGDGHVPDTAPPRGLPPRSGRTASRGRGPTGFAADTTVVPRPGERWIDDGDVVTAAGVSAGIDVALHLVRRLAGEERARQVRRATEYDPQPPV